MEQIIKSVFCVDSVTIDRKIQQITTEMNRIGFKLTALSCTAGDAYEKHNAYLVFTKE